MTEYQRTHKPVKAVENKCNGTRGVDGECGFCGRFLKRNVKHLPDKQGYFGYTLYFADGSVAESATKQVAK